MTWNLSSVVGVEPLIVSTDRFTFVPSYIAVSALGEDFHDQVMRDKYVFSVPDGAPASSGFSPAWALIAVLIRIT